MESQHSLNKYPSPLGLAPTYTRTREITIPAVFADAREDSRRDRDSGNLLHWLDVFWMRKWWVCIPAALGGLFGFIYSQSQPRLYQSRARVEIQGLNENYLSIKDLDPNAGPGQYQVTEAYLQTQIEILQSSTLISRVISDLGLLSRPELFDPATPLSQWKEALGLERHQPRATPQSARQAAVGNLRIKPVGQSRIIEISYSSADPTIASAFVNKLADRYIDFSLEAREKSSERTRQHLAIQMDDLRSKLERSGDTLQRFAAANRLTITGDKNNIGEDKLRQLQQELLRAQGDRVAKEARLQTTVRANPESVPEVLDSGPLRDYQVKIADLRRQLAEATTLLQPTNYKVRRIHEQIKDLERTAEQERSNVLSRIRNEFEAANQRERLLMTEYGYQSKVVTDQVSKLIRYGILRGEFETNRLLYDSMLQKMRESGIATAMQAAHANLLDAAEPVSSPSSPRVAINILLGLAGGLLFGVTFIFARERTDATFQEPGDTSACVNVRELGTIPAVRKIGGGRSRTGFIALGSRAESALAIGPDWEYSVAAESFRTTLASILHSGGAAHARVIVVTSPCPGEGKTTTVGHLGLLLARINRRVLVVDGDLRCPQLHNMLGANASPGLVDLLESTGPITSERLNDFVQQTAYPGLSVLSSGRVSQNGPNLLHSAAAIDFFRTARAAYEFVLIDSPPMLQIADARVLGRLSDGVVVLFQAGKTTKDAAVTAIQRFTDDYTPVIGTILNHCNPRFTRYGYSLSDLARHSAQPGSHDSRTS